MNNEGKDTSFKNLEARRWLAAAMTLGASFYNGYEYSKTVSPKTLKLYQRKHMVALGAIQPLKLNCLVLEKKILSGKGSYYHGFVHAVFNHMVRRTMIKSYEWNLCTMIKWHEKQKKCKNANEERENTCCWFGTCPLLSVSITY